MYCNIANAECTVILPKKIYNIPGQKRIFLIFSVYLFTVVKKSPYHTIRDVERFLKSHAFYCGPGAVRVKITISGEFNLPNYCEVFIIIYIYIYI
jgi:hypothetical protein